MTLLEQIVVVAVSEFYISHYKKVRYQPSLISCNQSGLILLENSIRRSTFTIGKHNEKNFKN